MLNKITFVGLFFLVLYLLTTDKELKSIELPEVSLQEQTTEEVVVNQPEIVEEVIEEEKPLTKLDEVLTTAQTFINTPYKFGGTTKAGMDCSGLVYVSYQSIDIKLPRSSKNMAKKAGQEINFLEVKKGDLLFFDIDKFEGRVNHVGLVTSVINDEVFFMHSTTEKGVITSSIKESYWEKAFVKAKRVL